MLLRQMVLLVGIIAGSMMTPVQAGTSERHFIGETPNSAHGVKRPTRGMTMDQVRKRFGKPIKMLPAVGKPPITRWVYGQYTVYYENQYVIHSVMHHH